MSSSWVKAAVQFSKDNAPTILSSIAVGGLIGTVVLAVRATPRALEKLAEIEMEADDEKPAADNSLSAVEIIQATWKFYLPAALTGAATIACIIGANQIGLRQKAAVAGAYAMLDSAFREYRNKVAEVVGEKKDQQILDKIAADRVAANPPKNPVVVIGTGEVMCFDMLTGRYFKSSHEDVRRAENELNREVLQQGHCDQNKFYELLGVDPVDIGNDVGWNIDHPMELVFSSVLNDCGIPCLAVGYRFPPRADYSKIY